MSPEQVFAKVMGIPASEVSDTTANDDLSAWDSMAHVNLILELESTYGISMSAEDAMNMSDVASIKDTLRDYGVSW